MILMIIQKKAYLYCTKKITIEKINKLPSNHYSNNNLFYNYIFARYINPSVSEQKCFDVPLKVMFGKGNILSKFLVIQFEQEVDSIIYKSSIYQLEGNSSTFDLKNETALLDQQKYQIQDYGGLTVNFKNGSSYNLFIVNLQISENEIEGYYITSNNAGEIITLYKYYNRPDQTK